MSLNQMFGFVFSIISKTYLHDQRQNYLVLIGYVAHCLQTIYDTVVFLAYEHKYYKARHLNYKIKNNKVFYNILMKYIL